MANITRYDPFEMTDPLDNLFRGFFRPVQMDKDMPQIRMDVKEDEKGYAVHADIPGVAKDDIHVTIDGNTVSISAEVKKNTEQKEGEKVLRRERYFGRVSRSFALENEVDEASASARYQDGVLELVLPKKTAAAAKRLGSAVSQRFAVEKAAARRLFYWRKIRAHSIRSRHDPPSIPPPRRPTSCPRRCPTSSVSTTRPSSSNTAATP